MVDSNYCRKSIRILIYVVIQSFGQIFVTLPKGEQVLKVLRMIYLMSISTYLTSITDNANY